MPRSPFPLPPRGQRLPAQASLTAGGLLLAGAALAAVGNIAPGPLDVALNQYARSADLLLAIDPGLVAGKRSPGLRQDLPPERALAELLAGTGLRAARAPDGSYSLQPVPAGPVSQLSTVKVVASAPTQATQGTGSYATQAVSYGGGASLRELPQSMSVLTRQRLEDQNLASLGDALEQAPGVTLTQGTTFEYSYYARGMQITNLQMDGGAPMTLGLANHGMYQDFAQYDRVEVLRGADALFGGSGEAGGTINLVRKRPLDHRAAQIEASAGSWDNYRTAVDLTGPLAFDGALRGRIVATHQDRKFFYDVVDQRNTTLYGILEADLGADTRVALGGSVGRMRGTPWFMGLPRYLDGRDLELPRSTSLTTRWSHHAHDTREIFARLERQLGEDWRFEASATRNRQVKDFTYARVNGGIDPITRTGQVAWMRTYFEPEQTVADAHVAGSFALLGQRHDVKLGASWQRTQGNFANAMGPMRSYVLDDFDPDGYWDPTDLTLRNSAWGQRQHGVYGALTARLTDPLALIVGGRYSNFHFEQLDAAGQGTRYRERGVFTPYAGLTYDLDATWTAYASLAQTYKSQASRLAGPLPGTSLDPVTGRNYEVGVKGSHAGGRYTSAVAVYRLERRGEAVRDPDYPDSVAGLDGSNCCWVDGGDVVSQGLDLELAGELLPGWQVFAGYTYNSNKNRQADSVRFSSVTPRHLVKFWSMVRLRGKLADWRVGGGVNVQSAHYVSGTANTFNPASGQYNGPSVPFRSSQAGYAVWNARAEYRIDANWLAAINVDNLFDKRYYQTVGPVGYWNWYGEPRSITLSLRGEF